MNGVWRLGRIAGIEIGLHYTWLIAFALVTLTLALSFFPTLYPEWAPWLDWLVAVLAALLLFGTVLVHELAHSLVARSRGLPVQGIALFVFGGVSLMPEEPATARDEFLLAVAGPASSLAIAALFWGLWRWLVPAGTPLAGLLHYLWLVNLLLALFNLLPGFPLDGGRVLRALLWALTGSYERATLWATGVGQGFALLLTGSGILLVFLGNLIGGLWLALIGWFLNDAAQSARVQVGLRALLQRARVRDIMTTELPLAAPDLSVRAFVVEYAVRRGHRAAIVVEDGRLAGIVTLTDVGRVPPEDWDRVPVRAIMRRPPLVVAHPDENLWLVLERLGRYDIDQVPVVEGDRVVGWLTRAAVLRYLHLRSTLGTARPEAVLPEERRVA